jgi:Copper amine oxidase N-terminal domain
MSVFNFRLLTSFAALCLLLLASASSSAVSIKFGQEYLLDSYPVAPYLKQGHWMVPAWVLTLDFTPGSADIGTNLGFDLLPLCVRCLPPGATSALIRRGNTAVSLYFGERVMRVSNNGAPERSVPLPVTVDVKASHLYVPLQAVARVLGFQVGWDQQRNVTTVSPSPFKVAFDYAALADQPLDFATDWQPVGWTSILNTSQRPLVQCPRKGAPDCVTDGWAKVDILAPPSPLVRRQAITFLVGLWGGTQYISLRPERVLRTVQLPSQFVPDPCIVSPVSSAKTPISCVLSVKSLGAEKHLYLFTLVRMTTFELASSQAAVPVLLPVSNPPLPRRRSTIILQAPSDCYDAFADASENSALWLPSADGLRRSTCPVQPNPNSSQSR